MEVLTGPDPLPGVRSFVRRGTDGLPAQVVLEERTGRRRCIIGRRVGGEMRADIPALDGPGTDFLLQALAAPGEWVCVDEIGFLEEASARYQQALWQLFEGKRVLAVIRKADLPFLDRIRGREDCLLLDLDEAEEWG